MTIDIFDRNANDFPLKGGYETAARAFIEWACTMPANASVHPLNEKTGSGISNFQPASLNGSMIFIGTYWNDMDETGPVNPGPDLRGGVRNIRVGRNIPILINPLISIISRKEHPRQFEGLPDPVPEEVLMSKPQGVMNKAETTVKIYPSNLQNEGIILKNKDLVRVKSRGRDEIKVSPGVWPGFSNGDSFDSAWDSQFIAVRGLEPGQYTIEIDAKCPMFDAEPKLFESQMTYNVEVS